jgi:MFS family permease
MSLLLAVSIGTI